MKRSKRLQSLALALLMVISLMPTTIVSALAAPEDLITEVTGEPETTPEVTPTLEPEATPTPTLDETPDVTTTPEPTEPPMMQPFSLGDPIDAVLYADNGTINFDGASDSAAIGYASDAEKDYNMVVVLTFPAGASNKSATIKLAEGLKFSDDGSSDATVAGMLSGAVVNNRNTAPFGLSSSMTNTGSKTYNFIQGAEVVTLSLTVRADSRYWYDDPIEDAITITMSYDGSQQEEVKLESLTVDSSSKTLNARSNYTGYAATDANIDLAGNYRDSYFSMASNVYYPHFFESFETIITISDPDCVVINTDPTNWTLDDTYAAIGIYTFTYKGTGGAGLAGTFTVPVQFYFPSSDFSTGDVVTVYRNANAKLYGGKTVFWAQRTMKFTIAGGDREVFVNYETMSSANSTGVLNGNLTAWSGSTSPTLSGAVGYYTVGNKGGTDSGPQTVELHFDQDKLGILGLYLAIPYEQTVTEVQYQTVYSGGWVTKTGLSLTASSSTRVC